MQEKYVIIIDDYIIYVLADTQTKRSAPDVSDNYNITLSLLCYNTYALADTQKMGSANDVSDN